MSLFVLISLSAGFETGGQAETALSNRSAFASTDDPLHPLPVSKLYSGFQIGFSGTASQAPGNQNAACQPPMTVVET